MGVDEVGLFSTQGRGVGVGSVSGVGAPAASVATARTGVGTVGVAAGGVAIMGVATARFDGAFGGRPELPQAHRRSATPMMNPALRTARTPTYSSLPPVRHNDIALWQGTPAPSTGSTRYA